MLDDPRLNRPAWRGRTNVDALTIACIERAEQMVGHEFVVTQGSYQAGHGDENSAGTHDLGGVVDLRWCGHPGCVLALRKAGMIATWHRTPAQGPWPHHIHAVVRDHPHQAASAQRQTGAVMAGRNGLVNNGPDDGPQLSPWPRPVWPWPPPTADPLDVVVFNAASAMPSDRSSLAGRILASARSKGDLLIGCECDDLEPDQVRQILGTAWWFRHRQADVRDGGFIAGRRDRTRPSNTRSVFGAPASPVNAERHVLLVDVEVDDAAWLRGVGAFHVPRWREGGQQAAEIMVRNTRDLTAALLGGDLNIRRTAVRNRYPNRAVRSTEVLHLLGDRSKVELGPARPFNLLAGTDADDHPGLRVRVTLK
jgi:hypothetical protein